MSDITAWTTLPQSHNFIKQIGHTYPNGMAQCDLRPEQDTYLHHLRHLQSALLPSTSGHSRLQWARHCSVDSCNGETDRRRRQTLWTMLLGLSSTITAVDLLSQRILHWRPVGNFVGKTLPFKSLALAYFGSDGRDECYSTFPKPGNPIQIPSIPVLTVYTIPLPRCRYLWLVEVLFLPRSLSRIPAHCSGHTEIERRCHNKEDDLLTLEV